MRTPKESIFIIVRFIIGVILLCVLISWAAHAAPPPLQSPKAASVPKSTPMTVPITEPYVGTMTVALTKDINILFCDTNDASCVVYDKTDVSTIQRAGYELRLYFTDNLSEESGLVATFGAAPYNRESGFSWLQPNTDRPEMRFFSERQTIAPSETSFRPAAVGIAIAPEFMKQVTPWTRRRTNK